jgi:hypothetical protein
MRNWSDGVFGQLSLPNKPVRGAETQEALVGGAANGTQAHTLSHF